MKYNYILKTHHRKKNDDTESIRSRPDEIDGCGGCPKYRSKDFVCEERIRLSSLVLAKINLDSGRNYVIP
jgi:hypothetical protein